MPNNKLCLHAGAEVVTREQVDAVVTPQPTVSSHNKWWVPVPHSNVIDAVETSLVSSGLAIADRSFALGNDGNRLFGLLTLKNDNDGGDYAVTLGLRNSHDRSFSLAFALGSKVFVCDNLAFSAEFVIDSKHTRFINDRLPRLVAEGVAGLVQHRHVQDRRIQCYKESEVSSQAHLHDLVLRAYKAQAIPATAITKVIDEFEEPRHPEFRDWTLWSLFNGFTEVLKGYGDLQPRTQRLHGVFDPEVGAKLPAV